jgi:hypothetical protein
MLLRRRITHRRRRHRLQHNLRVKKMKQKEEMVVDMWLRVEKRKSLVMAVLKEEVQWEKVEVVMKKRSKRTREWRRRRRRRRK